MIDPERHVCPPRAVIEHSTGTFDLPLGVIYLGRGEGCLLRLEDPSVSRIHLALEVTDRILAQDLGSKNGSLINGEKFSGARELRDGDLLTLGQRSVRVHITPADFDAIADETPAMGRATLTGIGAVSMEQKCPECEAVVLLEEAGCPRCGHEWPRSVPTRPTDSCNASVEQQRGERRAHARQLVDIPVRYESATLQIMARAGDVSRGGAFVIADRFDSVGTTCNIEFLPSGIEPATFRGHVCRVVRKGVKGVNGMAVEFDGMEDAEVRWLARFLLQRLRWA